MLFKSRKLLFVRFVLILILLGGTSGVGNVRAAPIETDSVTTVLVVSSTGEPLAGKPVYVFNQSTYTGYNKITDTNGEAAITLPEGNYRFRVDVDGTQFWSGAENHCYNCLSVVVTVPEPVLVTVRDTDDLPAAGLNVYAFNDSTYTGFHGTTNEDGQLSLRLLEGNYRFRADLNGTQFWSGTANHCAVPGCTGASVTVSKPMTVTVLDTDVTLKAGLNVYAFNGSTYTGYNKTTNADGQAVFTLPLGSYRFRADLSGTQFWSGAANHCDIPGCTSASVTVSKPMTVTVLDTDELPATGLNVYAFNGSTYTGYNKTTNTDGQAIFTLPLGSYRFRADLNGTQFWSGTANHCDIPGCDNISVTVSKPMTVTILDTDNAPKAGLNVYAFNGSTYTGYNKTTNADGQAVFTLPLGSYRFRADLNGTQFWSGTTNHCTLPGCESVQVSVTIPLTVLIQDGGSAPKAGVSVYAFNSSSYTGYSKVSDANGQTVFTLPLGDYRFRADYSGSQYWSGSTNHCTVPGCLSAAVTVGPTMTATEQPTSTPTATDTPTLTSTPTYTLTPTNTATYTPTATQTYTPTPTRTHIPATWLVTNTNDSGAGSLRQAIINLASGDTIKFSPSLAGQTITLLSDVVINSKKVVLDGSGLSPQVTVNGGGTFRFLFNGSSTMDIYDLTISNLSYPLMFRADATIRNSTLKGFTGDVLRPYSVSLTILGSTFENNSGGVISAAGSSAVTITDSILKNNSRGVIYNPAGSLTITSSTLSGNGGDAIAFGGTLSITDSTVAGNNGRAILANGSLLMFNTTIYQNSGEALLLNGGTQATIVNSTIVTQTQGNVSGILVNGGSDVDIFNSTIVALSNRVLYLNYTTTFNVYNSILMCTHQNECLFSNGAMIGNVDSIIGSNGTLAEYGLAGIADNGGPTFTMALLPGSQLIDGGDDAVCANSPVNNLDQRGIARPQGAHCDIGSYEYVEGGLFPTTTTITASPNPSQPGQIVTVTATVSSASGTPTGTVDFSVDGSILCTRILESGTAACDMVFTETKTVAATYHPVDAAAYSTSSGSVIQSVSKASTTTTVMSTPNPSIQGNSVNIQVLVANVYGGAIPTGTVTISSSAGVCTITLSSGQGNCAIVFNDMGMSVISAAYSGDAGHLASSGTTLQEVLASPPPTNTPSPTPTMTSTPTPGPTPVSGCNSIAQRVSAITTSDQTMSLTLRNTNNYAVTISSVFVAWNYAAGHDSGDTRLWLQQAQLGSTVFWTGNLNQPGAVLPLSTTVVIPARSQLILTFTFDKTYDMMSGEQIQLQFSTPGCEAYPVIVPAGSPTITPTPGTNTNLKLQLISGGVDNTQESQFHYRVQNNGTSSTSNLSVRLYFTLDGSNAASNYVLGSYYDQSGTATITGPTLVSGNNYYFTIDYGTAVLAAGSTWEFMGSLHLSTWAATYNATNDWWHSPDALPATWTDWNNILAYIDGTRVWGILP